MTNNPVFRWLFEDRRTGRIVIGQSPNFLMLLFLAATASRLVEGRQGTVGAAIRGVQAGSLGLWALDEALRGVNPARRIGGAAVVAAVPFRRMVH